MNKTELINEMVANTNLSKKDVGTVLDAFVGAVTESLANGERVQLVGFGTFETVERAARTGRNPSTGETIEIPASRAPKFKPGQALKDAVAEE